MRLESASEAARFAVFLAAQSARHASARMGLRRWRIHGSASGRLLIAPPDLTAGDPAAAAEIYAGCFTLGGRTALASGRSPFEIAPPSQDWEEALHGFGWLRHLAALETPLARANARALMLDWIALARPGRGPAWTPPVLARRILSWIAHAPFVLDGADGDMRRRLMRSLSRQVRFLRRAAREAEDGWPRLLASIALAQASLSLSGEARMLPHGVRRLEEELQRQILPDGGHVSRHPGVLIEALLDLLPLKETFLARGLPPPEALLNAIDRMMPMLRFFHLGRSGGFARMNGMGATPEDALAAVLAFDDARGNPVQNAPHSGYQRLEADATVLIADAGPPPRLQASRHAHAGCLSFELASGPALIVVNCGAPSFPGEGWRMAARATAAHSTVTVNDRSSCRFVTAGALARLLGAPIVAGPRRVTAERGENAAGLMLDLAHDGYEPAFGLIHRRVLVLSRDGGALWGEDTVEGRPRRDDRYAARFHLHPSVQVEHAGAYARLRPGNGRVWIFASNRPFRIEDSVFLAGRNGPQRTAQIVIAGKAAHAPRLRWSFERTG